MGCTSQREKIESKMLVLKLQRVVIKQKKKKIIGGSLLHTPIPDYIDSGEIKRLRRMIFEKQTEGDNSKDENDEVYVTNVPIYFISTTL